MALGSSMPVASRAAARAGRGGRGATQARADGRTGDTYSPRMSHAGVSSNDWKIFGKTARSVSRSTVVSAMLLGAERLGGGVVRAAIQRERERKRARGVPSAAMPLQSARIETKNYIRAHDLIARGELDKLEGPKYAARRAELRREEAARARDRRAAAVRPRRATRQRMKRQEGERREWDDREVPRGLQRESARDCEER